MAALVWGGEQKLLASDAAELDQFGCSVSLANDRALVGAYGESDGRGAAYVFVKSGDAWIEEQKLVASDGAEADKFGSSVSLGADRILVGAYGADASRGAAYVFVKSGNSWSEEQKLVASDGAAGEEPRLLRLARRRPRPGRGPRKRRGSRCRLRLRPERQRLDRGAEARRE